MVAASMYYNKYFGDFYRIVKMVIFKELIHIFIAVLTIVEKIALVDHMWTSHTICWVRRFRCHNHLLMLIRHIWVGAMEWVVLINLYVSWAILRVGYKLNFWAILIILLLHLLSVMVTLVVCFSLFLTNVHIKLMTDLLDKISLVPLVSLLAFRCILYRPATFGRFRNKLTSTLMTHKPGFNLV